jgi:hypothetical protein
MCYRKSVQCGILYCIELSSLVQIQVCLYTAFLFLIVGNLTVQGCVAANDMKSLRSFFLKSGRASITEMENWHFDTD